MFEYMYVKVSNKFECKNYVKGKSYKSSLQYWIDYRDKIISMTKSSNMLKSIIN